MCRGTQSRSISYRPIEGVKALGGGQGRLQEGMILEITKIYVEISRQKGERAFLSRRVKNKGKGLKSSMLSMRVVRLLESGNAMVMSEFQLESAHFSGPEGPGSKCSDCIL